MIRSQSAVLKRLFTVVTVALLATLYTNGSFAQTSTPLAVPPALVNVNSADLKTLETLPGVGSVTAKRIIAGRPYKTLADLKSIKGLSAAKLDALKDKLIFGPAATVPASETTSTTKAKSTPAPTPSSLGEHTKAPASTPATPASKLVAGQKLNINTATAAELDGLPGIGTTKAEAIVDYRKENGNFKTIEDIQKVKGIKTGTFAKIKDDIKVSD